MQRIVLATGNVGKQRELSALLAPLGCTLLLQRDLGVDAADETGSTFEANALLKAQHAAAITGLPALADKLKPKATTPADFAEMRAAVEAANG